MEDRREYDVICRWPLSFYDLWVFYAQSLAVADAPERGTAATGDAKNEKSFLVKSFATSKYPKDQDDSFF